MNTLQIEKQETIIGALVEGASIRSVERMTGVHRDTIMRLMVRVGNGCADLLDLMMNDLPCNRLELDEIWNFVAKKQKNVKNTDIRSRVGDFWTWVALDAETKLVPCYRVGKRDASDGYAFVSDLASRLRNRVQISSDCLHCYASAIDNAFGTEVDYAQIVKSYERTAPTRQSRYSPPKIVAVTKSRIMGNPNEDLVSTSYVERQNLTMRMSMRRFTRLTNGFSKKRENLEAAVGLHFAHYNLVRRHKTLGMTPAMATGIEQQAWTLRRLLSEATA